MRKPQLRDISPYVYYVYIYMQTHEDESLAKSDNPTAVLNDEHV